MINKKKLVPKKRARKDRTAKPLSKKKAQKRNPIKSLTRSQRAMGKLINNAIEELIVYEQKALQRRVKKEASPSGFKKVNSYKKGGHTFIKNSGRYFEVTTRSKGTMPGSPVGD